MQDDSRRGSLAMCNDRDLRYSRHIDTDLAKGKDEQLCRLYSRRTVPFVRVI
jgi:hypothetical protein